MKNSSHDGQSRSTIVMRWMPTVSALVLFGLFTWLYLRSFDTYMALMQVWGVQAWTHPFIDGEFIYVMKDAWLRGIDIYKAVPDYTVPNSFMNYPPLWPRLPFLPSDKAASIPIGLATDLGLIVSLAMLPAAKRWSDAVLLSLAGCSTMVVFALERNNVDVWIYLAMFLSIPSLRKSLLFRIMSYCVFTLVALLKYFPIVCFWFFLREKPWRFAAISAMAVLTIVAVQAELWPEVLRGVAGIPDGSPWLGWVGIVNIPRALARISDYVFVTGPSGSKLVEVLLRLTLTGIVLAVAFRTASRPALREAVGRLPASAETWLVAGCLLMAGCYLAGQSIGYRGIYLLFTLSGLTALERLADKATADRLRRVTVTIVVLMWMEAIRGWVEALAISLGASPAGAFLVDTVIWAIRELLWLDVAQVMIALILIDGLQTTMGQALLRVLHRPRGLLAVR